MSNLSDDPCCTADAYRSRSLLDNCKGIERVSLPSVGLFEADNPIGWRIDRMRNKIVIKETSSIVRAVGWKDNLVCSDDDSKGTRSSRQARWIVIMMDQFEINFVSRESMLFDS